MYVIVTDAGGDMYNGKYVRLRRLQEDDISIILPVWNDYGLRQHIASPLPSTYNDLAKFIESANEAFAQRKRFAFGIEALDSGALIGMITLDDVSWISSHGFIGMFAIFNDDYRGKGFGRDAMIVLLDVAFSVMDLHNVSLWVGAFNEHAIDLYTKIGFSRRGTLREMAYRNGKRYDVVVMDILKPEFISKYGTLPKEGAV